MTTKREGLQRLTERVLYLPHEPATDRPMLTYLKGDRLALAVDAGLSAAHIDAFYAGLDAEGLARPDLTVVTHWHWDHTFGMHRTCGLTIACERTNTMLQAARELLFDPEAAASFKAVEQHVALEYGIEGFVVETADISFEGELRIDLGGLTARLLCAESPHTDDTVLVHVPEEGLLFLGDATSGDPFEDWKMDAAKMRSLIATIESIDCCWCMLGHAAPLEKSELLEYLAGQV